MSTIIDETALSGVERVKLDSRGLMTPLAEEIANDATHLSEEAMQLMKFHGSYQQEDRDQRRERKKAGLEPAYSFMIRSKLPGGVLTADQYLLHDDLTEKYGDGTLRVTTRQGFQLYGVVKGDLRATIRELNEAMVTTFGACGDVVRNVCTCPAPLKDSNRQEVIALATFIRDQTLPKSTSYHDIWVEGVSVTKEVEAVPDPLYLDRYLPRKFKISFAWPDDNCTDLHSNDLGFFVIEKDGKIEGYNIVVGGGFGSTHGKAETFARLADPLGFTTPEDILEVTHAIIKVQRDFGNRENRKRSRLKYLIHDRGIAWFRERVEEYLGRPLQDWVPIEITGTHDHLGWHEQGDGRLFYGVFIENGRIKDEGDFRLRRALRKIVEKLRVNVHLTMQHNLLLTDVLPEDRDEIDEILRSHGVKPYTEVTTVRRHAMACPALPTCPLAVAESERALPGVIDELEVELAQMGLGSEDLTVRMTGCPNGCARPYTAEIAFVGRSLGKYMVYVGGNMEGTRLGTVYADLVPTAELLNTVRPLLEQYRSGRLEGEPFGDFLARTGIEPLPSAAPRAARS